MSLGLTHLYSIATIVLLNVANVILGILAAFFMAGGEYLYMFSEFKGVENLSVFDSLFFSLVLHPATAVIYTSLFCGVAVYQFKIASVKLRIIANVIMLTLSTAIVMKVAYIFNLM